MDNHDDYQYIPVEHTPECGTTFTFKVTIAPEGTARVELIEEDHPPPREQTR